MQLMVTAFCVCHCLGRFFLNIHGLSPRCLWFKHMNHELSQDLCEDSLETKAQWSCEQSSPGLSQRQVQRHSPMFSITQIPVACMRNCEGGELAKGTAVFTFSASDLRVSAGQDRYWEEERETKLKKDVSICRHPPETHLGKREHLLQ